MPTVEYKGKVFELDEDGFLKDGLEAWCMEWVEYVKEQEGIQELTEEHWKIINVLQDY
ncbi:MAG: TusE/DsrC/DsvC family sulfur relay protein, partial [Caldimicrobium sp.]